MKAISVRQPWAWLILHGKDVENRTWHTVFRGPVLIHASQGMTRKEWNEAYVFALNARKITIPRFESLQRGGIIGQVEIVNCVSRSQSPWFVGPWGFVLQNPKPLPFRPYTGALGFFDVLE